MKRESYEEEGLVSVTRYEMTTKYRGSESWDELEQNHDGAYVRYEDYEKLAAENAGLKTAIGEIHQELYGQGFEVSGWHLNGALEPLDSWFEENNWNPETPATNAFLAEVRASAVEEFVRIADYSESVADGEVIVTSSSVFAAGHEYAANLRKGVQS